MHSATTLPAAAPAIPVRDQFAPIKIVFLVGIHLGAVTAVWHWTWTAVGACILMHAACGGVGIWRRISPPAYPPFFQVSTRRGVWAGAARLAI